MAKMTRDEKILAVCEWICDNCDEAISLASECDFSWFNKMDACAIGDGFGFCDAYNMLADLGTRWLSWSDEFYYDADSGCLYEECYADELLCSHDREFARAILDAWDEDSFSTGYESLDAILNDSVSVDDLTDCLFKKAEEWIADIQKRASDMGDTEFLVSACMVSWAWSVANYFRDSDMCGMSEELVSKYYDEFTDDGSNLVKTIVEKAIAEKPLHVGINKFAEMCVERWCV